MKTSTGMLLLAAVLSSGCAPSGPLPEPPGADHPADYDPEAPGRLADSGWTVCRIDPEDSLLDIRVAPAGKLARLGHHHLISTRAIGGHVAARASILQADLFVAATDLVVDDPTLRRAAGGSFADPVPDDDRRGTRGNLLGPDVLGAADRPWLQVTVDAFDASRGMLAPGAVIRVAGARKARELSMTTFDDGVVTGRFELTHEALGLTPFTALGGALSVADTIDVRYRLALTGDRGCPSLSLPAFTR